MSEQDGSPESDDAEQTAEAPAESDGEVEGSADVDTEETDAASTQGEAGIDVAEEAAEGDAALDAAEDLTDYVESTPADVVADEIATLRFEVDTLEDDIAEYEAEVEELRSRIKRKQADFENYKKRMQKRREQEQERATEDLVTRLLDVRDNLQRALEQDEDTDIRDGVQSTLNQFDRVLEQENVEPIEPQPGDDVDPERHEVLVRMASDQPADTIAEVHRPGYEMAGKVIRAAQVAVSESDE